MIRPMLAALADPPLNDPDLVYEPKYDGIRAIAEVGAGPVKLWSRLGNEKTHQFPEVARALEQYAKRLKQTLVLDGEIVALDGKGEPAGFQQLQGRIHLNEADTRTGGSVAYIAFDLLREGRTDLRDRPLLERRAALERLFARTGSPLLRISRQVRSDGRGLCREALERGWEGLIAKNAMSLYKSGKRTPDWRKLKIVREQEFVIGGWTEPRQTRSYFGALLLGVNEENEDRRKGLVYVGHTGTGFNERELARLMRLLRPLETADCPFRSRPKTNERPHWVRPELVAQVKFTEWTADAKLRHPVYLGLRDDKRAAEVYREDKARVLAPAPAARDSSPPRRSTREIRSASDLIRELRALEDARRDGVLVLPDGDSLSVTNLAKVFWPARKLTKGDLFRYYVQVAPALLPVIADRPLVMKRLPNGIAGKPFYQHRAPDPPRGVRVERVPPAGSDADGKRSSAQGRPQIIGGTLKTLLYTTQLAAVSEDPWFSRVQHPQIADHAALDLDPSEGVPFARVLDVARWIHDELQTLGATGAPKTSGSRGIHIYIPLPPGTPYAAGLIFCQIVATLVAKKHPKVATIERAVAARGRRVYVDYLQNIMGKTLASTYSARASDYAGVSTPLTWREIDGSLDPRDFTIETVPGRLERAGDIWADFRRAKGIDLERATGILK
jgi:bifunctional non-homologous end joining protein LigD